MEPLTDEVPRVPESHTWGLAQARPPLPLSWSTSHPVPNPSTCPHVTFHSHILQSRGQLMQSQQRSCGSTVPASEGNADG